VVLWTWLESLHAPSIFLAFPRVYLWYHSPLIFHAPLQSLSKYDVSCINQFPLAIIFFFYNYFLYPVSYLTHATKAFA
jgi:hypothetical protein